MWLGAPGWGLQAAGLSQSLRDPSLAEAISGHLSELSECRPEQFNDTDLLLLICCGFADQMPAFVRNVHKARGEGVVPEYIGLRVQLRVKCMGSVTSVLAAQRQLPGSLCGFQQPQGGEASLQLGTHCYFNYLSVILLLSYLFLIFYIELFLFLPAIGVYCHSQ